MASIARTGQLRRRNRLVSVPVPVDPLTLRIREIQKAILSMQQQYECPVCLDLISEPHASECGHYFCRDCILQHISISSKKSSAKCPLCKETVTKRSLVENSNMGDISKAIRQLTEGFHLDTGISVTTPYVGGAETTETTNGNSVSNVAPIEKKNSTNESQDKNGPIVNDSSDLCRPLSHLNVTSVTGQTETETETNETAEIEVAAVAVEKQPVDTSKNVETNLEKKIQGSELSTRPLDQNSNQGVGFGKPRLPMQRSKKRNITNIISEILGLSDESGPISPANDFNQSDQSMGAFRPANLGAKPGNCDHKMELSTGTTDMPTLGFSSASKCLSAANSKMELNGTETQKKPLETPNLELNDEFRSKRLKSGIETKPASFASGMNLLGMCRDQEPEQTETNTSHRNNEKVRHFTDLVPVAAETLSGIGDFSPVKFSNQKASLPLDESYDQLPINESEIGTGTVLSSTLRQEIPTNQKLDEGFSAEDILNLTFSDVSQISQSNDAKIAQCGTEIGTKENEITLTQFLTQYPGNANITPNLATGNMLSYHNNLTQFVANLEPTFKAANQILSENYFSLELSRTVTHNQTRLEMELRDLISEAETETMDSVHFAHQTIPNERPTNQISPVNTQYSNLDIFTPLQEYNISSSKLELTLLENGTMQKPEILAEESVTNFEDSHLLSLNYNSELLIIPATPSTKDASHSPTQVAKGTPNAIVNNRSFDFSHLTEIIHSQTTNPVGYSSAPLESHSSFEVHT